MGKLDSFASFIDLIPEEDGGIGFPPFVNFVPERLAIVRSVPSIPLAPTGLSADVSGFDRVSISFTDPNAVPASSYRLYRGLTNSSDLMDYDFIASVSNPAVDTTADLGVTYYYVLTAVNGASVESEMSASVSARLFVWGDLGGYQYGLDADTGIKTDTGGTTAVAVNGDLVAYATDVSGNGRHATQATSGNRFKWARVAGRGMLVSPQITAGEGSPTVRTLTTPSFLDSSFDTAFTIYTVVEFADYGVTADLYSVVAYLPSTSFGNAVNAVRLYYPSAATEQMDGYTQSLSANTDRYRPYTGNNRVVMVERYNGSTKRLRVVGKGGDVHTDYSVTGNLGLSGAMTIGDSLAFSGPFSGLIGAVHVFNSAHSDADVDTMVASLRARWLTDPPAASHSTGVGTKVLVTDGNSLTAGYLSSGGERGPTAYPAVLGGLLGGGWSVTNRGRTGYTMGQINSDAELRVDSLFSPMAAKNVCILWEICNDLYFNGDLENAKRRLADGCLRRRAKGWYVIAPTSIINDFVTTKGRNSDRLALNTWWLANGASYGANVIPDIANYAPITDNTNMAKFQPDKSHLTDEGYADAATFFLPYVLAA